LRKYTTFMHDPRLFEGQRVHGANSVKTYPTYLVYVKRELYPLG